MFLTGLQFMHQYSVASRYGHREDTLYSLDMQLMGQNDHILLAVVWTGGFIIVSEGLLIIFVFH